MITETFSLKEFALYPETSKPILNEVAIRFWSCIEIIETWAELIRRPERIHTQDF